MCVTFDWDISNLTGIHVCHISCVVVVALTCLACAEVQVSALVEAGGIAGNIPWTLDSLSPCNASPSIPFPSTVI